VSRVERSRIPQEAVIGIVYAVCAAAAILVVDRAPQGGEHIKQLLVGSILTVTPAEVGQMAVLYAAIGGAHWLARRALLEISLDPAAARQGGRRLRAWDFFFYATFGVVVTSSVRIAGVLLVFAYLIVPAATATLVAGSVAGRLLLGWLLGAVVSGLGLAASYAWDLPTGAAIVTAFGGLIALAGLGAGVRALLIDLAQRGWRALRGPALVLCLGVALAGLLLVLAPAMDHHWLDWLEAAVPPVQLAFLTPGERATFRESRAALVRGVAEVERLRGLQQDVQWGVRAMPEAQQERLRQFLASRGEINAGERMVLARLRRHARERQRFLLGLPLLGAGAVGAAWLARSRGAPAAITARGDRAPLEGRRRGS
jgi:zinc/manganese transport system permease protein